VTKIYQQPVPTIAQEQSAATPVQFLPSTMLSWRMPIMAVSGLPATAGRKMPYAESLVIRQTELRQPAS